MMQMKGVDVYTWMCLCLLCSGISCDWSNTLRGMLLRSCMYGFGISGLYSQYDPSTQDRLWKLDCAQVGFKGGHACIWTKDFINLPNGTIDFTCRQFYKEEHLYISGFYSDFDTNATDRIWRVECCSSPGVRFYGCIETEWQNEIRGELAFDLPQNMVLHGIKSNHIVRGDRSWKFNICQYRD